jgi:NADP-dependent 3-hydroxy acid dehydrogenase YdfG
MPSLKDKETAMTRSPNGSLKDTTVLVVGRGSGLARAVVLAATDAGAHVVAAGRDQESLPAAYASEPAVRTERVTLTNTFLTGQTLHIDGGEPLT